LVQGSDGNFYGTASQGGIISDGTVFRITPKGALTTLHSFNYADGFFPTGSLIQATDGNFYGMTNFGGSQGNCGTIFRITPAGKLRTLQTFDGIDGAQPWEALVQATSGAFYGTTYQGGADNSCLQSNGCGTVFSLNLGFGPFVGTLPVSGKVGAPVKILGTSLTGSTSVTFNRTAATFKVVSSSLISTAVPPGATTGPVQVVTPGGTLTSNVNFQVLP
jgi:uncharacterized repeat protein (TIGR03803 family)